MLFHISAIFKRLNGPSGTESIEDILLFKWYVQYDTFLCESPLNRKMSKLIGIRSTCATDSICDLYELSALICITWIIRLCIDFLQISVNKVIVNGPSGPITIKDILLFRFLYKTILSCLSLY